MSKKYLTPTGILSYPNVFKVREDGYGNKNFSVNLILEDEDVDDVKGLIAEVAKAEWDTEKPDCAEWSVQLKEVKDGPFAGRMQIVAKCDPDKKPIVVDAERKDILNTREVYGGAIGRLSVGAYAWEYGKNAQKKGVSFDLLAVQKLKDGDPLGNATIGSADDFADSDDLPY